MTKKRHSFIGKNMSWSKCFNRFSTQFVDLCILLGCDYCETIRGIGPKRALELVSQYKSIEEILKNIDKSKYVVPEDWNYEQARQLFMEPEVADPETVDVSSIIVNCSSHFINKAFLFICEFFCHFHLRYRSSGKTRTKKVWWNSCAVIDNSMRNVSVQVSKRSWKHEQHRPRDDWTVFSKFYHPHRTTTATNAKPMAKRNHRAKKQKQAAPKHHDVDQSKHPFRFHFFSRNNCYVKEQIKNETHDFVFFFRINWTSFLYSFIILVFVFVKLENIDWNTGYFFSFIIS